MPTTRSYWQTLDDDGSGDLSKGEFYDLCDILQFSFKRVPKSGWAKSWAGPGRGWLLDAASPNGSLYKLVRGGGLDHAVRMFPPRSSPRFVFHFFG